ncbi:citrulline utilization hydrolase CtlX [Arcticibacter eurypsychrophilus]|uniref:citrulline utilization hydrolase CtlX n=1 Tax=Arcticibacter eurypsychrophilus TaxID=1434752 RepID=UPI00084DDC7F|nr:arginine deiminase-related protein [Arcticibacter eurypsychrophilus]
MQTTPRILMIRPSMFGFNDQTALSNLFQHVDHGGENIQSQALEEFNQFVALLRVHGVLVLAVDDDPEFHTPDAIFPNNWISTHEDGSLFIYPMEAENRRQERNIKIIKAVQNGYGYKHYVDLSFFEQTGKYLEGTGSMVLDRVNHIAYACLSSRTNEEVLAYFAALSGYRTATFQAIDASGKAIYHTNVMMSIGDRFAVICLEAIAHPEDRDALIRSITATQKEIIPISLSQMNAFAGNLIQISNKLGESLIVMSTQAFESLDERQKSALGQYGSLIHSPLWTIERFGGGSARCMIAEIHVPYSTNL